MDIAIVVGWSVFFCADLIFPSHEKIPKPPGGLARSLARGGPGQGRGQLEELQVPRLPRFANPDELNEQRFYVWKSDVRLDLLDGMFMSSWKSCCWLLMFGHSLPMFAWRIWCRLKTKRQLFDAGVFPSYLVLLLMDEILHQLIGSASHYLQAFIHPRWLFGISSTNSTIVHLCFKKDSCPGCPTAVIPPRLCASDRTAMPGFLAQLLRIRAAAEPLDSHEAPQRSGAGWQKGWYLCWNSRSCLKNAGIMW